MDIKLMMDLQDKVNNLTCGDGWEADNRTSEGRIIDWRLCMTMETIELMDSLNWKHWKDINSEPDLENAYIEAIDIFHFVLSEMIEKGVEEYEFPTYEMEDISSKQELNDRLIASTKSLMLNITTTNTPTVMSSLMYIFALLGKSHKDIMVTYIGKVQLNILRQYNGYADGTYVKMWKNNKNSATPICVLDDVPDGHEAEDNRFMVKISESLDHDSPNYADELMDLLSRYYTENMKN